MTEENLWGEISIDETLETPVSILKAQAVALNKATKGILDGRVIQSSVHDHLVYEFRVVAPSLGNYSATILRIVHDMTLYPVEVDSEFADQGITAADPGALRQALKRVFQSEEVRRIVRGLAAQAIETSASAH